MLYKIKPLEWDDQPSGSLGRVADGTAEYAIIVWDDGIVRWNRIGMRQQTAETVDRAKQICQSHWESEAGIGQFLEPEQKPGM